MNLEMFFKLSFLKNNYKKVIINLQINQYITQNKNDFQILWWYYIPLGYHRKNVPKIVYAKKVIEVKTEKLANRIYKDRKAHTLKYLVLLKYMEWWFLIFVNVPYRNKHILCTAP